MYCLQDSSKKLPSPSTSSNKNSRIMSLDPLRSSPRRSDFLGRILGKIVKQDTCLGIESDESKYNDSILS